MLKALKRLMILGAISVLGLAIYDQLVRTPEHRNWHGDIFGIPYDFRPPTPARVLDRWWNPADPSLLTPQVFGVGWSINLVRLWQIVQQAGQ